MGYLLSCLREGRLAQGFEAPLESGLLAEALKPAGREANAEGGAIHFRQDFAGEEKKQREPHAVEHSLL